MKNLQSMNCVDEIVVVCDPNWKSFVESYAKQHCITKFVGTVEFGETRQGSIVNGVKFLFESHDLNEIVFIVDANRPLIPERVFIDALACLKNCDCVISTEPCYDSMYISDNGECISGVIDRTIVFKGQVPECSRIKDAYDIYEKAVKDGYVDEPMSALFFKYGKTVKQIRGSAKAFKITTADDLEIFKALLKE